MSANPAPGENDISRPLLEPLALTAAETKNR
jgi:hypothetical protein